MFRETKQYRRIRNIIWDWNGTLLDDVDICISCINLLLDKRQLKRLDVARYREIFTFPVTEYYEHAGFDFSSESFAELAVEFIGHYRRSIVQAELFPDVIPTLERIKAAGIRQFIVSAMEHSFLTELLEQHRLTDYFESYRGIEDHHAHSKTETARKLVSDFGLDSSDTLFIGDTLHDHEVAEETGISCLLIHRGHQSESRLLNSGTQVFGNLSETGELILRRNIIKEKQKT